MEIKVLKSYEISTDQWKEITCGFNLTFDKTLNALSLLKYYTSTIKGFSYHALSINDEGKIVGANSVIPMPYKGALIIGYSSGTYILKEYRNDISLLKRMLKALENICNKDGIVAILAVPNSNSFTYFTRIASYKMIGDLNYYLLCTRVSALTGKKYLILLDLLTLTFSWLSIMLNFGISSIYDFRNKSVRYELETDEDFYKNRFFQDHYVKVKIKELECYYRIVDENGIRTAYILDFRIQGVRTLKALSLTLYYIMKENRCDVILFIGHLRLRQFILWKVPSRFEPQRLSLVFKLTNENSDNTFEPMKLARNWDFSLINFDTR